MSNQYLHQPVLQISVEELASRLAKSTEGVYLLDVREPQEVVLASLEGFENLPLSQFSDWADQIQTRLNLDAEVIVMCHHGIRSAQMCQWLKSQGFRNVKNVAGGIEAYAVIVDPAIPRY